MKSFFQELSRWRFWSWSWAVISFGVILFQSRYSASVHPSWILSGPFAVPLLAGLFTRSRGLYATMIGSLAAQFVIGSSYSDVGFAIVSTLAECGVAIWFTQKSWPFSRTLAKPHDVIAMAMIVMAASAAHAGAALIWGFLFAGYAVLGAITSASVVWISLLLISPAIFILSNRESIRLISGLKLIEATTAMLAVLGTIYFLFLNDNIVFDNVPLVHLSILALFTCWIALRFETAGMSFIIILSAAEVIAISILRHGSLSFFPANTPVIYADLTLFLIGLVIVINLLVASVAKAQRSQNEELILIVNALRQKAEKLNSLNKLLSVQTWRAESQSDTLLEQNGLVEEANQKLAQQKAWIDAVLKSLPVDVFVVGKDGQTIQTHQRTQVTPGLDVQFGTLSLSGITKKYNISHIDGTPFPDEKWPIFRALQSGKPNSGELMRLTLENGDTQILSVNAAPIRSFEGDVTGAVAVSMDVTEIERTNERLRESDERLQFALTAARTVAWEFELGKGLVRRTSSVSDWLGLPRDDQFPRFDVYEKHIHQDDREEAKRYFYSAITRPGDFSFEYRMVKVDGGTIWVTTRGEVIADENGKPRRIAGVHIDVTVRKEAELRLRLIESAVAHARDAVALLDAKLTPNAGRSVLYVNEAFCSMSGYSHDELVGRSLSMLRGPDSDSETLDEIRSALEDGRSLQAEILNYRKNGTGYWVDLTLELVRDTAGRMSHWVMIQRDITDRKRAEDALRRSEEMFRGIFENAWAGVSLTDSHGRFVSVNPAFEVMMERSETDLLQLSSWDITEKESWLIQKPLVDEVLEGKRDRYQLRKQYLKKDGTPFWGELFFNAIRGPSGDFLYGLGVTVDVTERTRLENQLRESEGRLRAVYENTAAGFIVVDTDAVILEVNPAFARMLGYESHELIGMAVRLLTHPDDFDAERKLLNELIEGKRDHVQVRKRYFRKDGSVVVADLFTQAVRSDTGEMLFRIGVAIDVTEQIKLEDQLRQAQKMEAIGQMAGGIAHDFNNLLTAVIGNLALVNLPDQDSNRVFIASAEQAAGRAADLTRKLLGYARRSQLVLAPIQLNEVISEVIEIIGRTFDPRIIIQKDIDDCPSVFGDVTLLNQVLFNLCLNSRDALPDGGIIRIGLSEIEHGSPPSGVSPGRYANLSVTDNGHGMVSETRSKIFEPFFTTKGVGKGTGLGLAMVQGIIQQHGGWVDCDSAPGVGTRFDLYLPIAPIEKVESGVTPVSISLPDDTPVNIAFPQDRKTILLVDDDPLVRNLAKVVLETNGYVVAEAADGLEAVQWVRENPSQASLIIMDLTMPRMSGRDAFHVIREMDPSAQILFSSGYSAEDFSDLSEGLGMLSKPYRPNELIDAVQQALRGRLVRPSEERRELSNLV